MNALEHNSLSLFEKDKKVIGFKMHTRPYRSDRRFRQIKSLKIFAIPLIVLKHSLFAY